MRTQASSRGRRRACVVALICLVPIGTSCTSSLGAAPATAEPPRVAPRATSLQPCIVPSGLMPAANFDTGGQRPNQVLTVEANPAYALAVWLPGPNAARVSCRSSISRVDSRVASRLATTIGKSRMSGMQRSACPGGSGAAVDLYFIYGHAKSAEAVHIDTAGCGAISAPDRRARELDAELLHELLMIAPNGWVIPGT